MRMKKCTKRTNNTNELKIEFDAFDISRVEIVEDREETHTLKVPKSVFQMDRIISKNYNFFPFPCEEYSYRC